MNNMQEKEILQHTKQAIEECAPDCFDEIWEKVSHSSPEAYPLPSSVSKSQQHWRFQFAMLAACLLLTVGISLVYVQSTVYATIHLDVNPSIEIEINRFQQVLSITGENDDGDAVVNALQKQIHPSIRTTLTDTIQQLGTLGYLSTENENAVLLSVDGKDSKVSQKLANHFSQELSQAMDSQAFSGNIVSQTILHDAPDIENLADDMHISKGKATLIYNIANQNHDLAEKDLANMNIQEIIATAKKENMDISQLEHRPKVVAVTAAPNRRSDLSNSQPGATMSSSETDSQHTMKKQTAPATQESKEQETTKAVEEEQKRKPKEDTADTDRKQPRDNKNANNGKQPKNNKNTSNDNQPTTDKNTSVGKQPTTDKNTSVGKQPTTDKNTNDDKQPTTDKNTNYGNQPTTDKNTSVGNLPKMNENAGDGNTSNKDTQITSPNERQPSNAETTQNQNEQISIGKPYGSK